MNSLQHVPLSTMWSSPPSSRSSSLNQSPARFEVSDSNVSMAKWPVCRERRDKRSQLESKLSDASGRWHLSLQCTAAASRTVSCICTSWMTVERWYKMEALDCKRLTPKPDIYCRCLDHKRSSAQEELLEISWHTWVAVIHRDWRAAKRISWVRAFSAEV